MTPRSVPSIDWFDDQRASHPSAESSLTGQTDSAAERTVTFDRRGAHAGTTDNEDAITRELGRVEEDSFSGGSAPPPEPGHEPSAKIRIRAACEPNAAGPRPATAPDRGVRPRKVLLVTLFWAAFIATLSMWWFNTGPNAVKGETGVFMAAGRITGLISGFLLLVVILTTARLRTIESWFGASELRAWRRALGGAMIVLVLVHALLLTIASSWQSKSSAFAEAWSMLTTTEGIIGAAISSVLLVVFGTLSIRAIRRRMPHEMSHGFHLACYAVMFLAFGHQFALGSGVIRPGLARWYWTGLHLFALAALLWGRVLRPAWFNVRHEFRVANVRHEADGWVTIDIGGRALDWIHAEAGQYLRCRFLTDEGWWQSHPFAIAATPNGEWLRVRVKAVGRYTKDLLRVEPGVGVLLSEPTGSCVASRRLTDRALIIAGGAGVAPVAALLGELPMGAVVIRWAESESELVFRDELERFTRERETKIYYVTGSSDKEELTRAFSPIGIRELVPDVGERDVYVCGPRWLVDRSAETARWLRVPRGQVHLESYEW